MSGRDDKLNGFALGNQTVIRASALRRMVVFGKIQAVQAWPCRGTGRRAQHRYGACFFCDLSGFFFPSRSMLYCVSV